jgi:tRNA (guanine37-N1)-methyltransferase
MLVADAVARLRPGVVGLAGGVETDSHAAGRLEHPHYTRPFRGWAVPSVLVSGDHGAVDAWRKRMSLQRTAERRPDMLAAVPPDVDEARWLQEGAARP